MTQVKATGDIDNRARGGLMIARRSHGGAGDISVTKGYHWAKIILACVTVLVAEAAFLGLSSGGIDWRSVAVSLALAWGVIQFVEFFLLKDAIENCVAKGVVDWVRDNIKVTEVEEHTHAPEPSAVGKVP